MHEYYELHKKADKLQVTDMHTFSYYYFTKLKIVC